MHKSALVLLIALAVLASPAWSDETTAPHVKVSYTGIDAKQATALAETASAAWKIYTSDFGFDLPETVLVEVTCGPNEATKLFTDGQEHLYLSLPSKDKLDKPAKSGVFNLYGVCHELGHMVMYRVLKQREWMSSPAAEGWAHFAGSTVVDRVYAAKGESLWADRYDYRADGTARLSKELAGTSPSAVSKAAGQWQNLEKIIGGSAFPTLFAAWESAGIDPQKPNEGLIAALTKLQPGRKQALTDWWKAAAPVLVEKREASKTSAQQISSSKLSGKPTKLANDDDSADGKKSIAGGGHARKFEAPGSGDWYLSGVSIHGSRYGAAKAPDTTFEIALCDSDLKPISTWKKPYAKFERGGEKWVRFEIPPTRVPKNFYICLNFNPTASSGVYVSFDSSTSGSSLVGTPGRPGDPFGNGDWMIRVEVDQAK